jgi:hypothetical protein
VHDVSQDQERIKAIVALKQRLETRLAELDAEAKELQLTLEVVNGILLEKGFKRGSLKDVEAQAAPMEPSPEVEEEPAPKPSRPTGYMGGEPDNVIPLKTVHDESLAIIYIEKDDSIHVLPDESKHFSVNTMPFTNFLVERVFAKMQDKDTELVRLKQLTPEQMFSYNIVREDDLIREIILKNVDEERLKELKSSIKWTFDKMYEKMKLQQQ